MMKIFHIVSIFLLSAGLLTLTACCDADEQLTANASSVIVEITDDGYQTITRATENGYRTTFEAGDACGLYIVRNGAVVVENVKLTATRQGSTLTWQAASPLGGGLNDERYFLYYPYQSDMTGKVTASATGDANFFSSLISGWAPAANQSTKAAYTSADLMTATGTATRSGNTLRLSFSMSHRMALAVINTSGVSYTFTKSDAQPYSFSGNLRYIANPSKAVTITGTGTGNTAFVVSTSGIASGRYKVFNVVK